MGGWPAHGRRVMPWKSSGRPPREDRMFTEVEVSLPPHIANLGFEPSRETVLALEEAAAAIASLDVTAGSRMAAISDFLLRSEAVSSSKIEHVDANRNDYARALAGLKASDQAKSMVAAAEAVQSMINDAGVEGEVRMESLLKAHRTLMKDDPLDGHNAGSFREVQNWIGGSDYSPRGAVHVPPHPGWSGNSWTTSWPSVSAKTSRSWHRQPLRMHILNPSTRLLTATAASAGP